MHLNTGVRQTRRCSTGFSNGMLSHVNEDTPNGNGDLVGGEL